MKTQFKHKPNSLKLLSVAVLAAIVSAPNAYAAELQNKPGSTQSKASQSEQVIDLTAKDDNNQKPNKSIEDQKAKQNTSNGNPRDGGFLMVGLGYGFQNDKFVNDLDKWGEEHLFLSINARYQMNGFFVEMPGRSVNRQDTIVSLGYNFYNGSNWSLDAQFAMNHPDITYELTHQETGEVIYDKRVSRAKLGVRALGIYDEHEFAIIAANSSGVIDPSFGSYIGAWYTKNFNYKNLSLHATVGGEYRSQAANQYFYGSYAGHENYGIDSYRASSGVEWMGEVGFEYPITENWFVEGFVRGSKYSDSVANSPFVKEDGDFQGALVVNYVF